MGTVNNGQVCGLFAGIGGLELGLHEAGYSTALLCEIDEYARAVLADRFPSTAMQADITDLRDLPPVEIVTAGFPCQDLSMAGVKVGIAGARSGLVHRMLHLLSDAQAQGKEPRWLVVENVPYMLHLDRGRAMREIVRSLEELGFKWAYRVVDARGFGVPQRRRRVLLIASRTDDPRLVLFSGNSPNLADDSTRIMDRELAYGFYWTEGKRGLGWAVDAVPTIKGGSTIGIPSPPAIWIPATGAIGTPDIRDLERLQGFPPGWTAAAETTGARGGKNSRWKLVGNAVCVDVAKWLGRQLVKLDGEPLDGPELSAAARWPDAAWGGPGFVPRAIAISACPMEAQGDGLRNFLRYPLKPLSYRATCGYLNRAAQATALNFPSGFLQAVRSHAAVMAAKGDPTTIAKEELSYAA